MGVKERAAPCLACAFKDMDWAPANSLPFLANTELDLLTPGKDTGICLRLSLAGFDPPQAAIKCSFYMAEKGIKRTHTVFYGLAPGSSCTATKCLSGGRPPAVCMRYSTVEGSSRWAEFKSKGAATDTACPGSVYSPSP
jgi:hypothetical protein